MSTGPVKMEKIDHQNWCQTSGSVTIDWIGRAMKLITYLQTFVRKKMDVHKHKIHLIATAILIKLVVSFCLLLAKGYPQTPISEIVCTGDCAIGYVPATYNLINYGKFTIYSDLAPYSGRMPGYEFILAFSTLISDTSEVSFIFVVILQSILAGISMYCLADLSFRLFGIQSIFIITYGLYGISTYNSLFDISGLTESVAISLFIVAFSLLFNTRFGQSKLFKLLIGFLLLLGYLLRQYLLPFFALWALYIIYTEHKRNQRIKSIALSMILYLLPLIAFEGVWIYRNYQLKDKFIPFVDSAYAGYDDPHAVGERFYFPPENKALANFIKSWGGDFIWWNDKAEITAFISSPSKSKDEQRKVLDAFPSYIYTDEYNKDSLLIIQEAFQSERVISESDLVRKLEKFEASFRNSKPLYYFVIAPVKLFVKFIFHSGTYNLFDKSYNNLNFFKKGVKVFYSTLYLLIVISGFIAIVLLMKDKKRSVESVILVATALYIILLVVFVMRRIEYRHFAFAYPYFVILSSYFVLRSRSHISQLRARIKNNRSQSNTLPQNAS